ncbi:MAG: sensor histidine kinase, partial [Polaribacter sp.]
RNTISLNINDEKETFFLKIAVNQTNKLEYLVVSLETIQQLIDKKEKEAWYKLMNVMSHEIINTITPISSLAENLDSLLQEENTDEDTIEELSKGLSIIKRRSQDLTSFVDTYRKLAELPMPNKKEIDLTKIINTTLGLYKQEFADKNIRFIFNNDKTHKILADKQQIEQILINLISNCLYALEDVKNPTIQISISEKSNRLHLEITDNGIGISDEIKENLFIPYFTTHKNGSGIGLTLTKNIMEAHKGTIHFNSKKGKTSFTITFLS